jgi:glycosyltransferase involved in cell wall biosynthesis
MTKALPHKKVAIIADWLTSRGGAEHVVFALAEIFEQVQVFTSVYNQDLFPEFQKYNVQTTFLQKLPTPIRHKHQFLLPLFPKAFQSLDLSKFDIIISSSSSGFSKCVQKTREDQIHICYCHTPVRFLYHAKDEYLHGYPLPWFAKPAKALLPQLLEKLTKIDQKAITDVDYFISNSDFVGERVKKYYHQEATTLYPGVDTTPFVEAGKKYKTHDYFFAVGRFIPYKKFDLLVQTFLKNGLPLKLGGTGPELEKCKKMVEQKNAKNIEFLGFIPYPELAQHYAQCRAFLFPAEEDFGLTPVEAMSAGTPVIYYNAGGAMESVGQAQCGLWFDYQTPQSLQSALDLFLEQESSFDRKHIQKRGQSFDVTVFKKNIEDFVKNVTKK